MKTLVAKLFVAVVILAASPAFTLARTPAAVAPASPCGTCNTYTVYPAHFTTHRVYLNRGHAHIHLSGDGDTDLDLFVYDSGGLAASSVSRGDDEMVHLDVNRSGWFTIKVVNLGSVYANNYQFWVE
jgi:hypothetical protein